MGKILNFGDFNKLNEARAKDPNSMMIKDLPMFANKRLVNIFMSLPSFGGFHTKDLGGDKYEVFVTWKGEERPLGIVYNPSAPFDKWANSSKERFDYNLEMRKKFPLADKYKISDHINNQIEELIKQEKEAAGDFNPFDADLESLPVLKDLQKIGAQIVSTPIERKNGTLAIKFPNWGTIYTIQKTGYIRRKGISGYLSNKPELIKPIFSLDDLTPKLTYIYNTYIREVAQVKGIPLWEINDVIKSFSEDGTSSDSYMKKYQEMVNKEPSMALYLPKPENLEDTGIIQGAKLLGRMGIF